MKLSISALFAVYSTLASGSPVDTAANPARERKRSNLLQASRNGHPLDMFVDAARATQHDTNTLVADAVQSNPCVGDFFCGESNLPGDTRGSRPAHPVDFFVKDFEKMDELPDYNVTKPACHPKCRWTCDNPHCNSICQPRCKPPKCVTACKKMTLSKCKRVCRDPQCCVVCPPTCVHGACPSCKTVCGKSVCELQCGKDRCESQCADPECTWDCKPNPACQKPTCTMTCDQKLCSWGKDQALPAEHEVPYMGQEVAWKGLGHSNLPHARLGEFEPQPMASPQPMDEPDFFGGSLPLPPGGLQTITGETGITAPAIVDDTVQGGLARPIGADVLMPYGLKAVPR